MGGRDGGAPAERLAGRHAVHAALRAGRPINRLLVARGIREGASLRPILALARARGIPVQEVDRRRLDAEARTPAHQGVVAVAAPVAYADPDDVLARAWRAGEPPFLVMLDSVEDPGNLGSILRTADAAGVHGVIIPARRAAGLSPAVAKAAAGAIEHVPVARVANLNRTAERLRAEGIRLAAADAAALTPYHEADLGGPIALIVGGEDRGVGRALLAKCDVAVRMPMRGRVPSLNVAVAAALLMYEVRRRRDAAVAAES